MQADGRIEDMDVTLLDPHGGELGGFFMLPTLKAYSTTDKGDDHLAAPHGKGAGIANNKII